MKLSLLAVLSAPLLASAQYGYGDASSSAAPSAASSAASPPPVPSAGPGQHIVTVGAGGLKFTPNDITAKEGEIVTFVFQQASPIKHSVTQSGFAAPCTLLSGGFDSGLQDTGNEWNLTITNASQPIWFFCTAVQPAKHCGMGMVGGINIPSTGNKTVDAFKAAAMAIGSNEQPQSATGGLQGVGAKATAPAAAVAATPPAGSSAPAPSGSTAPKSGALQITANAGGIVATLFALFALV